jgi:hypothetical protein
MSEKIFDGKIIIDFIRKYYVLDFSKSRGLLSSNLTSTLLIRDVFDDRMSGQLIPISFIKDQEVFFIWDKAKILTCVDPYHKKFVDTIPDLIIQSFRHQRTNDFFKYLYAEGVDVIIPLNEIKEELPNLFNE